MKLFSAKNNKTSKPKKNSLAGIKKILSRLSGLLARFESLIIILLCGILLALAATKMLRLIDPPINEDRVQENTAKLKQIHIDQKIIERIKQLSDSKTSPKPNFQSDRTNPFSED